MKEETQIKLAIMLVFIMLAIMGIVSYIVAINVEKKDSEISEYAWWGFAMWFAITFLLIIPGYVFIIYAKHKRKNPEVIV